MRDGPGCKQWMRLVDSWSEIHAFYYNCHVKNNEKDALSTNLSKEVKELMGDYQRIEETLQELEQDATEEV